MPYFIPKNFSRLHLRSGLSRLLLPLAIIVLTIVVIIILKSIQPVPPVKIKQEKIWSVQTHTLVDGNKSPHLELFGQIESPYTANMSASISADVNSLMVKEGQSVHKDQLLIMLDESEVKLTLEQRRADIMELDALMDSEKNRNKSDISALKLEKSLVSLAEKKLAREEKTSKNNLTSRSSFDSQKQGLQNQKLALKARQLNISNHPARLTQLKARLAHKRALLQQAEKDLQRATIKSPFNGIVLSTDVAPGEHVRTGDKLLSLYSTENVELRAQLPQKYISTIKQALKNQASLQASAKSSHGSIQLELHRISGAMAETGIGVDALFDVNKEDAKELIMGEVLEISLHLPALSDIYSIPVSSIYGTNRIYLVKDSRLLAVNVEKIGVQTFHNRQFVLIRSEELHAGNKIITTQLPHAVNGLKVEIRNDALRAENISSNVVSNKTNMQK